MARSRHEGGSDILSSPEDLYVALGVRLRERPGAHWVVEMHPETRAAFDSAVLARYIGSAEVRLDENSHIARGEFHLMQHGFDRT